MIVHLYEQEGDRFVERLRGMFAIAIYDRRRQRLVLARDRLGKKPLYYAELPGRGGLAYASEMKALLTLPEIPRAIDETALLEYFTYRGVPAPRTILRAVRKLRPGHGGGRRGRPTSTYAVLATLVRTAARRPARASRGAGRRAAPRERAAAAGRRRAGRRVPLGRHRLGRRGGRDGRRAPGDVQTFCVGFDDPRHDERADARSPAQALGTIHTDARVPLDPEGALDALAWHFDEPFSDSSAVPTYAVAKLARQHVTVALSGDGGDECFAGYDHHRFDVLAGRLRVA